MKKATGIWNYIGLTYLTFWIMLVICGAIIMVFDVSNTTFRLLATVCSWSPTIVLIVLYKKLEPNKSLRDFYKDRFKNRINVFSLLSVTIIMFLILFLAIWISSGTIEITSSITVLPSVILVNLLFAVIQGASGEESGWRGYLLPKMESKYGFLIGNLMLGTVWGLWHLPLWFISGEYFGLDLLQYIVVFMTTIILLSLFIGVVMRKYNNLFIAFWIHLIFNFSVSFYTGDVLKLLTVMMFGYIILTVSSLFVYRKQLILREV